MWVRTVLVGTCWNCGSWVAERHEMLNLISAMQMVHSRALQSSPRFTEFHFALDSHVRYQKHMSLHWTAAYSSLFLLAGHFARAA